MKKLIFIQLLILITVSIFSQTLTRPVNAIINSDYGPRQHPRRTYDWHKVRLSPATYRRRTFYSIFPQFSSPQPGNGHIVHLEDPNETEYDIDIKLTIRASGSVDNTKIVSGTLVSGFCWKESIL